MDLFTDGRDTYEKSALKYLDILNEKLEELQIGKIATISGRYYGMDRDNNFDRLKLSYDAICYGEGPEYDDYKSFFAVWKVRNKIKKLSMQIARWDSRHSADVHNIS